jgi:predicted DNA-binding antitoxin AbrB/MazE fold protein
MSQTIAAIFHDGRFEPLEPVSVSEGERVNIMIVSERDRAREILGDVLVDYSDQPVADIDEEALLKLIAEGYSGTTPLSETIIQERREGP